MTKPFLVPVHNDESGERRIVTVEAACVMQAVYEALHVCFRALGWHRSRVAGTDIRALERQYAPATAS